jgi:uncharacterized membrane protein
VAEEHQRHTRARLEAFSDIVFGFSLAQLALTLPPPVHFSTVRLLDIFAFTITFALVCFIWWRHHEIFRDYFVPDTPSIVLNFILLAAVALMAYALEAYLHGHESIAPVALYAVVFGMIFLSMGLMVARGLPKRPEITTQARYKGKKIVVTFTVMGIIFLASLLLLPFGVTYVVLSWLLLPVGRVVGARLVAREAAAQ